MRNLRILHLTTAFRPHAVGGAEVVVTTLTQAQAKAGHSPFVAHLSPKPELRYEEDGVVIIPLKHRNIYDIKENAKKSFLLRRLNKFYTYYNPGVLDELSDLITEIKPDILHTHSLVDLSTQIWRISRKKGVPVVHTIHDYDLLCGRSSLFRNGNCQVTHPGCWVHKKIKKIPLAHVNAFASISDFVVAEHQRWGAFGPRESARTTTIWNPLASPSSGQNMGGPTGAPLRLGFLGRLVLDKGIGLLLNELRILGRKTEWSLAIGGVSHNGDSWLRQKAEGLPVTFMGWVEPSTFLSAIDVLIVPSLWNEPFGLTVIEGLLSGKIVLGSKMGAIPEILSGLGPKVIFDPTQEGCLAKKIGNVIDDPETHRPDPSFIGEMSLRLSANMVMKSYDDLYKRAMRGED